LMENASPCTQRLSNHCNAAPISIPV
jgi:hypothetical protein